MVGGLVRRYSGPFFSGNFFYQNKKSKFDVTFRHTIQFFMNSIKLTKNCCFSGVERGEWGERVRWGVVDGSGDGYGVAHADGVG